MQTRYIRGQWPISLRTGARHRGSRGARAILQASVQDLRSPAPRSSTSRCRFWAMRPSSFSQRTSSWCCTRSLLYAEASGRSTKPIAAKSGASGQRHENGARFPDAVQQLDRKSQKAHPSQKARWDAARAASYLDFFFFLGSNFGKSTTFGVLFSSLNRRRLSLPSEPVCLLRLLT